jgi:hypothetical protein
MELTLSNQNLNREQLLNKVHQIAKHHLSGLKVRLYLFGSWARGEERSSSDIDLAVDYDQILPSGTLARLKAAYEESNIPYTIDLVDLTQTDPEFKEKVEKEGVRWSV